jgi:hypothetical protein
MLIQFLKPMVRGEHGRLAWIPSHPWKVNIVSSEHDTLVKGETRKC